MFQYNILKELLKMINCYLIVVDHNNMFCSRILPYIVTLSSWGAAAIEDLCVL